MCLAMDFFVFFLLGVHSYFWMCGFISFAQCEKFSTIISSSTFTAPPSFFSPFRTLMTQMLDFFFLTVPQVPEAVFTFFSSLFYLCCLQWVVSIVVSFSSLSISFIPSILLFIPSTELYFQLLYFLAQNFHLFLLNILYFLAETFYFFICFKYICNCPLKHLYDGCFKISARLLLTFPSSYCWNLLLDFFHSVWVLPGSWYE